MKKTKIIKNFNIPGIPYKYYKYYVSFSIVKDGRWLGYVGHQSGGILAQAFGKSIKETRLNLMNEVNKHWENDNKYYAQLIREVQTT